MKKSVMVNCPTNQKEFLQTLLQENNYHFSSVQQDRFLHYLHLLRKWNSVFNLTAIRDPHEMILLHLLDSLSINSYLQGTRIIDVGTGAGLPGIPLALVNPEKKFVLLDSNNKKTRFLTQAILELKIKNIDVVHARCENFHAQQGFDCILSRAFASLSEMLVITKHLLKPGGGFLAMKGAYPEQEIRAIPLEFKLLEVYPLVIKGLDAKRHLVCLTVKGQKTP